MAKATPLAIAVVVLVSLTAALVARAAEPTSTPLKGGSVVQEGSPPSFVAGSPPPGAVAACLSLPAGQRASCFRNLTPSAVAACRALSTRTERAACFRKLVPPRVAACLALPTRQERTTCFKKLRRRP